MADFRPASVPYDPTPDALPSTQAPDDYLRVRASPDDFGAQVGRAVQGFGQQLGQSSDEMFQLAQRKAAIQNEAVVNGATNQMLETQNKLLFSPPNVGPDGNPVPGTGGYYSQNGANAVQGYQTTVNALNDEYQRVRSTLSPMQQKLFDQTYGKTHRYALMDIGKHADTQGQVWQDQQTDSFLATTGQSASLAAVSGKFDQFDHLLDQGVGAAQHWAMLKGYGKEWGDEKSQTFVGETVANAAKQMIDGGRPQDAAALLEKYEGQMDKGNVLAVKGALKGDARAIDAQKEADQYLSQMGYGAPPQQDQGGTSRAGHANFMQAGPQWGNPRSAEFASEHITSIQAPNGETVQVNKAAANAFQGFLNDLAKEGYDIRDVQGYNVRNIRGSSRISQHAFGNAIDINPENNPLGSSANDLPANVGELAAKNGLIWGGSFRGRKDPMHFEWAGGGIAGVPNDQSLPAGMRNNNPGNIKFTSNSAQFAGAVGPSQNTDQGDPQVVFSSPQAGMDATYQLARQKYDSGMTTANQLVAGDGGWTPGNSQAAANIAKIAGVGPDDDLHLDDPAHAQKFLRGLVTQEHGPASQLYSDDMIAQAVSGHAAKAQTLSDKASIINDIRQRYANDPQMADAIIGRVNQGIMTTSLQQQAAQQQALADQDAAFDQYIRGAMKGGDISDLTAKLADDPRLSGKTRNDLYEALQKFGQGKAYGSDFYSLFQKVHEDGNDKISDPAQLLPQVDGQHLTLEGFEKLRTEIQGGKNIDSAAEAEMRKGTLAYIKQKLTFSDDTMMIKDPTGDSIFNGNAIPAFYKAYEDGIKAGKTPYQLLSKDSPDFVGDKIVSTFKRSNAQEMKDRIAAGDDAVKAEPPAASTFDLNSPEGIVQAFHAGSISRADAGARLDAMRKQSQNPVPNQ